MPIDALPELRRICLALPETAEKLTWEETPTFRVRDKIFAMQAGGDGRPALWCKAPPGAQAVLVGAEPSRFFVPPYVGHRGWVGVRLDVAPDWPDWPDWEEIADLVLESYCMTAPKRLLKTLGRTD